MEAVGQDQAALVWWKVQLPQEQPAARGSAQGGKSGVGQGGGSGGGRAILWGDGAVRDGSNGGEGEANGSEPKEIGFVVYRYRLDGREWHKKGATNVDGHKAASSRIKGLRNGVVYRYYNHALVEAGRPAPHDTPLGNIYLPQEGCVSVLLFTVHTPSKQLCTLLVTIFCGSPIPSKDSP